MRPVLLTIIWLLVSGCLSPRVVAARDSAGRDSLTSDFSEHVFPIGVDQAVQRLEASQTMALTQSLGLLSLSSRHVVREDGVTVLTVENRYPQAQQPPLAVLELRGVASGTRVRCTDGQVECIRWAWKVLGSDGLAPAEQSARAAAGRVSEEDPIVPDAEPAEAPFTPVWGFTFGLGGSLGFSNGLSAGTLYLRGGARRWNLRHFATAFLLEYELGSFNTAAGTSGGVAHVLSPTVHFEMLSAPSAKAEAIDSLYLLAAPVVMISNGSIPGSGFGARIGVGGQAFLCSLEIYGQRMWFNEGSPLALFVEFGLAY